MVNPQSYFSLLKELPDNVTLVAVSKTKSVNDIKELYDLGHRDFGENYVQELLEKQEQLPADIRWHFIGHLQSNKARFIAPFIHLIHGIDSLKLLLEVDKQAKKNKRTIDVLLQVHIAMEETKFGFEASELKEVFHSGKGKLEHVVIKGLMGMASFTGNPVQVRKEFAFMKKIYDEYQKEQEQFSILSMGMSADYHLGISEGSNMVRIGSLIFGDRK